MKKYGIMYKTQWVKAKHILGQYVYTYVNEKTEVSPLPLEQAKAIAKLFAQDKDLPLSEVAVVEI